MDDAIKNWTLNLYVSKEMSAVRHVRNSIFNDKSFYFIDINYHSLAWTSVFMED